MLSALIIDDEPLIVRSVSRQLASFEVTTCVDPQEALSLLESPARFDVILCDLMMPGLSGAELHGALSLSRPDRLPRMLFMTGGAVTAAAESFLADPLVRHLLKPFTRADLVRALEDVLMTQPS
jgi:CheY-like chemotaxis protein